AVRSAAQLRAHLLRDGDLFRPGPPPGATGRAAQRQPPGRAGHRAPFHPRPPVGHPPGPASPRPLQGYPGARRDDAPSGAQLRADRRSPRLLAEAVGAALAMAAEIEMEMLVVQAVG